MDTPSTMYGVRKHLKQAQSIYGPRWCFRYVCTNRMVWFRSYSTQNLIQIIHRLGLCPRDLVHRGARASSRYALFVFDENMQLVPAMNTWFSDDVQSSEGQMFIAADKPQCTEESRCGNEAARVERVVWMRAGTARI